MEITYTLFKRCPTCRGEFQQHVERCPDCGTTLVASDDFDRHQHAPGPSFALGPDDLTPGEDVTDLGVAGVPVEIRRVSVQLSQERIRHWLIPRNVDDPLAVYNQPTEYMDIYVQTPDLAAASEVVRGMYWSRDGAPEGMDLGAALANTSACPACSMSLPGSGADECPECGLVLGG